MGIENLTEQIRKLSEQGDEEAADLLKLLAAKIEARDARLAITSTTSVRIEAELHTALKIYGNKHGLKLQQVYEQAISEMMVKRKYAHSQTKGRRFRFEPAPAKSKNYTLNISSSLMDSARDIASTDNRRLCDVLYTALVQYAESHLVFEWSLDEF